MDRRLCYSDHNSRMRSFPCLNSLRYAARSIMRPLSRNKKKILDCVHLVVSALWLGAFALSILIMLDPYTDLISFSVPDAYAATLEIRDLLIKPLIPLLMVTGALYGIATKWGFLKTPWVKIKWVLSISLVASIPLLPLHISTLLFQMGLIVVLFVISVCKPKRIKSISIQ